MSKSRSGVQNFTKTAFIFEVFHLPHSLFSFWNIKLILKINLITSSDLILAIAIGSQQPKGHLLFILLVKSALFKIVHLLVIFEMLFVLYLDSLTNNLLHTLV